ncbi:hypothetical protein LguiA_015537 [Lonicera macranthoides]
MAPSSSSSSSSSSLPSLSPPPPLHPPPFTPIQECEREGNEDEESQDRTSFRATPSSDCMDVREVEYKHRPTPLHHRPENRAAKSSSSSSSSARRKLAPESSDDDRGVSCNKCRPSTREKISVVPLDNRHLASPNGLFKSIMSSLVKKSPRPANGAAATPSTEEQWKSAAAELSHKLVQATRKRDEAILEASKLKYSMAELERKLNKLEIYCHGLKSGLEECSNNKALLQVETGTQSKHQKITIGDEDKVIEHFLLSISESRSSIRLLSRSLTLQLRHIPKVYERISSLLQPYDIKISISKNPRGIVYYLEALLNKAFFEDFESIGFQKNSTSQILNPIDRCKTNFAAFVNLKNLTWEDVLNKGTKHFSHEFSKFCDRKMSEIVAMLGWNRAWSEQLLQTFFGASRSVWLVHLLANSVHPGLPIFRVGNGDKFDSVYMEDLVGDKARKLVPAMVRIMVLPGFYVYGSVVKCKVMCRYQNGSGISNFDEKGLTPSPI